MLLSCSEIITLHDIENETKPLVVSNKHKLNSKVNCATFNHNSRVIASGGDDGVINFHNFNLDYISCIEDSDLSGGAVTSLSFNNNSNYLAYGATSGHLKIWDLKTSNTGLNYKFTNNYITSLCFNNDSNYLTTGTASGEIYNFNMLTLSPTTHKFGSYFKLNYLKYSPLMTNLVGAAFEDGCIKVMDMTNGEIVNNFGGFHQGSATSISFSPINKVFLCSVGVDSRINFFDISAKKHIKTIPTESQITSVSFFNDGQTIACGNVTGNIVLYDLRYFNTPKAVLTGHESSINYLEFAKKNYNRTTQSSLNNTNSRLEKEKEQFSISNKSNRSFGNIDSNRQKERDYIGLNTGANNTVLKNDGTNQVNTTQNNFINKNKNDNAQNLQINSGNVSQQNMSGISVDFKDSSFKEMTISGINPDRKKEILNNKKEATSNMNNSNLIPNVLNVPNLNLNSSLGNKTNYFNNQTNQQVQNKKPNLQIEVEDNLTNKTAEYIKTLVETEMFKMRSFVHEEINSLHVDLIRQFEIQHNELIRSMKNFSIVNNKMAKELDKLMKENKELKSKYF